MMIVLDKKYEEALLFDFYGELLTEKQRAIFEESVLCDLSLSEVAEEHGISRQGVHDTVRRCAALLASYEEKLKLVEKFIRIKQYAGDIIRLTGDEEVRKKAEQILEEL